MNRKAKVKNLPVKKKRLMEHLPFMHPLIVFQGRFQGSDRTKAIAKPNSH